MRNLAGSAPLGGDCFVYVGDTARYLLDAAPSPPETGHELKECTATACGRIRGLSLKIQQSLRERVPRSTEGMSSLLNVCTGPFLTAHVRHHRELQRYTHRIFGVPVEPDHENSDRIWRDPTTGFAKEKCSEKVGEILVQCRSTTEFVGYWNNLRRRKSASSAKSSAKPIPGTRRATPLDEVPMDDDSSWNA